MRVLGVLQNGGTILFAAGDEVETSLAAGAVNYAHLRPRRYRTDRPARAEGVSNRYIDYTLKCSAPPSGPALRRTIRERMHADVTNKYSSNETNPISVVDDEHGRNAVSRCGRPHRRRHGRDVARGEAGLIRVRTETMVHGYFNDQAQTKASFIDGWYQTSDMGFIPAQGKLVLLGRADDMLNIGGVKTRAGPIESGRETDRQDQRRRGHQCEHRTVSVFCWWPSKSRRTGCPREWRGGSAGGVAPGQPIRNHVVATFSAYRDRKGQTARNRGGLASDPGRERVIIG